MGIIWIEQTDSLLWLGRYAERVYTGIKQYIVAYDAMIDGSFDYADFCHKMGIPNIYESQEDFRKNYAFDRNNPCSIASSLYHAYDNAIILREEIGSEALAFIQLSVYDMQEAEKSMAPMLSFQHILDHLMGFWGTCDDMIFSENVRNILKTGKRIERVDLYGRLKMPKEDMEREICRLLGRIVRTNLKFNNQKLEQLSLALSDEELDYPAIVTNIESLFIC